MKRLFLPLLLLALFGCVPAATNEEEELALLNETLSLFNQAFRDGNLAVLDSLTTDNYTHTNSSGKAFPKASWFSYLEKRSAQLASGELVMTRYELQEKEVKLHGSSAIITGKILTAGTNKGEPFERALRISNFWVKENGTWKRAGFHDTRIN